MDFTFLFDFLKPLGHPVCSAVILAAGNSTRMGTDKIMMDLCGKPVILRTILAFEKSDFVDEIVIVTNNEKLQTIAELVKANNISKVSKVILGGATRAESSLAGVCAVSKKAKLIAIHDGARPFVDDKIIKNCIYAANEFKAAIPGISVTDTLKKTTLGIVSGDVDRNETIRIQTPQIFNSDLIKGALTYAVTKKIEVTDDSSAVELLGVRSKVVEGDSDNIKLTTMNDIYIAEAIVRNRGL